jgi:ubiquinone/menaquinone biosynthesis C-methylase UbiE
MELTYPDESYDVVFMSHLLHHVADPRAVVGECHRVLRQGGTLLNRYGALENIQDDSEHRFFPEALPIDEARTPSLREVEAWFAGAGFVDVSSTTIYQQTYESGKERLERARLHSTSVLTLISPSAFEKGLQALAEYVSGNPDDPWLRVDKISITSGSKASVG